jgi:peptidoglycan-associated lipoprotein
MRKVILGSAVAMLMASSASAQLPFLSKRTGPPPQQQGTLQGVDALKADFLAKTGADTIFFGIDSAQLGAPARTTLTAQATWLRQHPEVVVRIEGHGDTGDTRDHAIAMGARRAEEVRSYLVLLGVPAAQLSATTWGKERPGSPRAVTVLVR